jgi:hypothetical protein
VLLLSCACDWPIFSPRSLIQFVDSEVNSEFEQFVKAEEDYIIIFSPLLSCYQSTPIIKFLFKAYCFLVEMRFERPNDPESYAGGSVSFW